MITLSILYTVRKMGYSFTYTGVAMETNRVLTMVISQTTVYLIIYHIYILLTLLLAVTNMCFVLV